MGIRGLYSQLRRGFIGRFGDAYIIATVMDGFWPGVLTEINSHILVFAGGVFVINALGDLFQKLTKPEPPPCGSVEPELNFKDDDK
jgi:hypothetical protein